MIIACAQPKMLLNTMYITCNTIKTCQAIKPCEGKIVRGLRHWVYERLKRKYIGIAILITTVYVNPLLTTENTQRQLTIMSKEKTIQPTKSHACVCSRKVKALFVFHTPVI